MDNEDVGALLRRYELRATPQRRAILQAFRGTRDEHLSAEEVLSRASVSVPEIGRGTVYATLAELADLGLLQAVGDPQPLRYESHLESHDHFQCRLCLRLFDIDLGGRGPKRHKLPGFTIEKVSVRAQGICSDCHDYQRGLQDGAAEILEVPTVRQEGLSELSCRVAQSPVGELALAASRSGLVRVAFSDHADFAALAERGARQRGPAAARARLRDAAGTLEGYFGGGRSVAPDEIDWRLCTPAGSELLLAVQAIAFAGSSSYQLLDGELSPYARGHLMGRNPLPLLIPCHRVSCGSLRPELYVGGAPRLAFLRRLESV